MFPNKQVNEDQPLTKSPLIQNPVLVSNQQRIVKRILKYSVSRVIAEEKPLQRCLSTVNQQTNNEKLFISNEFVQTTNTPENENEQSVIANSKNKYQLTNCHPINSIVSQNFNRNSLHKSIEHQSDFQNTNGHFRVTF